MPPILYHYEASPFAELVRAAFGLKGLAWDSLMVPRILPKPDQTRLTGGYGRTPVVQIGADIYCDTAAILPALEATRGLAAAGVRIPTGTGRPGAGPALAGAGLERLAWHP